MRNCLLLLLTASAAHAQDTPLPALHVEGSVSHPLTLTNDDLARQFASVTQSVKYTLKGKKARAHCVPLLAVAQAAIPTLDPKRKNAHQQPVEESAQADFVPVDRGFIRRAHNTSIPRPYVPSP